MWKINDDEDEIFKVHEKPWLSHEWKKVTNRLHEIVVKIVKTGRVLKPAVYDDY